MNEEEKQAQNIANVLIVVQPELGQFLQSRINELFKKYKIKSAVNDFEATKIYHKCQALEDLLTDIINLNVEYIKNNTEQPPQKPKIKIL